MRPPSLQLLALGALAALASPAFAQTAPSAQTRSDRLYLGNNVVFGSTRVTALGGAFTAVADGVDGIDSNLAALAQRAPDLDHNWDLQFAFDWQDVPLFSPKQ